MNKKFIAISFFGGYSKYGNGKRFFDVWEIKESGFPVRKEIIPCQFSSMEDLIQKGYTPENTVIIGEEYKLSPKGYKEIMDLKHYIKE